MFGVLLSHGAEADPEDEYGERPRMWAAGKGFEPIVKMLLAKGASIECLDQSDESPLLWALRACTSGLRERVTRSHGAVITNGTGDTNAVVRLLLRKSP